MTEKPDDSWEEFATEEERRQAYEEMCDRKAAPDLEAQQRAPIRYGPVGSPNNVRCDHCGSMPGEHCTTPGMRRGALTPREHMRFSAAHPSRVEKALREIGNDEQFIEYRVMEHMTAAVTGYRGQDACATGQARVESR